MFWLVSGKGRRRPFCPDDEWVGLTGHFSLALSYTLFLSFPPSSRLPPASPPPSNPKPQFVSSDWGPADGSTRWQIYRHRHEVKRLKPSVTPKDPLPGRQDWSAIYICWGPIKGQHISPQQGTLHFSENCSHFPIQLESKNFLIPLNISGFLSWCFYAFGQMSIWTICVRFPYWVWRGESWESFSPGQHTYRPMSGSWLEVCSDGVHRCNNPPPPNCHKTASYRGHN